MWHDGDGQLSRTRLRTFTDSCSPVQREADLELVRAPHCVFKPDMPVQVEAVTDHQQTYYEVLHLATLCCYLG